MKKKQTTPPPPTPERTVIAGVETTFEGRLEKLLTTAFASGYVLSCPPVFLKYASVLGENQIGYSPHFLVILQKSNTKTA